MPVSKEVIKKQIKALSVALKNVPPEKIQDAYADGLATIIMTAIKSATVTVPAGQLVVVAGSPATQSGATTTSTVAIIT